MELILPIDPYISNEMSCARLSMVEHVRKRHAGVSLDEVCIIGVQHLLPSTMRMFLSLIDHGLSPDRIFLLGKCYSTNAEAFEGIKKIGINVDVNSLYFDSHEPYDKTFRQLLNSFVDRTWSVISRLNPKKIIVMDDGGALLGRLQEGHFSNCSQIIGIEQTSSGYRILERTKLRTPIINVARSRTKLIYESRIVANNAVQALMRHLDRLRIKSRRALIIGGGPIGKAIYRELRKLNDFDIAIYDIQQSKSSFQPSLLQQKLPEFDLIIGCSGSTSIDEALYSSLSRGSVLVSTSSSDREFHAVSFRKQLPHTINCHNDLYHNGLYMLNCGFPINFDDSYETVDPKEYELTRSLLSQAIFQAASMPARSENKFYSLNTSMQKEIIEKLKL